jgi:hypothetical protein
MFAASPSVRTHAFIAAGGHHIRQVSVAQLLLTIDRVKIMLDNILKYFVEQSKLPHQTILQS